MGRDQRPRTKNRSHLALRSEKLHRATQLGIEHPEKRSYDLVSEERANVLFLCSKNQWRSPTAEAIYRRSAAIAVRSAGTSHKARRRLTVNDLRWADVVLVMEEKHRQRLFAQFPRETRYLPCHVLGIPDEYGYMDDELVAELRTVVPIALRAEGITC